MAGSGLDPGPAGVTGHIGAGRSRSHQAVDLIFGTAQITRPDHANLAIQGSTLLNSSPFLATCPHRVNRFSNGGDIGKADGLWEEAGVSCFILRWDGPHFESFRCWRE
ncbi:MAG: hypothetical protein ACE5R6_10220 [Candidatus Heimdallarchaeota archaeon]